MPKAGDAYLTGDLPLTHDPLGRIDYHPNGPIVDLQAFIDAVTNFLNVTIFPIMKSITGLDFSSPEEFFFSLASMVINGGQAVLGFVTALTQHIIDAIINALTGGQGIGQPIALLQNVLGGVASLAAAAGDAAASAANFIGNALGLVVQLVQGVFPVYGQPTDVLGDFGSSVGGIKQSADTANVGVARLEGKVSSSDVTNGVYFDDTFARSGANLGADYDQANTGPAGGTLSTDGNNAVLYPSGAGQTYAYGRIITPLFTDYQAISVVQNTEFRNIFQPGEWTFGLRCNAARTDMVIARIGLNFAAILKVVGGSATTLAYVNEGNAAGDKWTFKAGTNVDVRELLLYHGSSSTPLLRVTDTASTLSTYGSSNRFPIIGQLSAQSFVPPFFTNVEVPPAMQSVTAYDRLPTA